MTQEIIEMARQAGLETQDGFSESVFYFAKLVAEKERDKWMNKAAKMMDIALNAQREADAKICEALEDDGGEWDIQQQCANAIRARGQA